MSIDKTKLAKALAMRLVVAGGIAALLAVVFAGEIGSILSDWFASQRAPVRLEAAPRTVPADPGWPQWRGPHYSAVSDETDLADAWPAEGPPVLWSREIGQGYSGFSAVGDRVFTQTQSLTQQTVVCLDADTGRTVWQHRYDWPYEAAGMYPGPRATPTWYEGYLYFAGPDGLVGCLDAASGSPLWQRNVNQEFGGRGTDFGYSCSPTVEQDKVVMPVGGEAASVVALHAADGSTVWTAGDEPASYCTALPITFQGRRYVVAFLENALAIHDLATGERVWQQKYARGYNEHAAAPLYDEPYLMIACPFQSGSECYRLEAGEAGLPALNVDEVWSSRYMSNDTASSVLLDGHVYGFDLKDVQAKAHRPSRGKFKCMELATGKVLWETDQVGHATVVAADGKLILFSDKGELLLGRATAQQYEELARTEIFSGEICWTAPTLHRGRLYLRSPSKVACVFLGDPTSLTKERLADARPASQLPKTSRVDLTWFIGGERPYAFDPPDFRELMRWYAFSLLGVLALAAMFGAAVDGLVRVKWPTAAQQSGRLAFWIAAFVLGVLGTPIYNRLGEQFIFTWPVCLCVVHQATLWAIVRAGRKEEPRRRRDQWFSLLAVLAFVIVCVVYFLVCRRLSLAIEWTFLMAFLPSWFVAVPAAYRLQRPRHMLWDFCWSIASFTLFFWAAGALMMWKAAML